MAGYIDKDALLEFLKVNKYEEPSTDFQRGANANADLIFGEIKYFHTADLVPRAEAAREIFEEIEQHLVRCSTMDGNSVYSISIHTFNRIKKKHTEDSTDGKRTDR